MSNAADASPVLVVGGAGAGKARHLTRLGVPTELRAASEVSDRELAQLARNVALVLVGLGPDTRETLPVLRDSGTPLWVDLSDWNGEASELHDPFVDAASHLFLSDIELDDPLGTAERLLPGKELVVLTHGKRGATAFFPDTEPFFVLPYDEGPAADTTGARDGFCGGTVYGIAHGWDWPRALRAGAVLAGGCVSAGPADADLTAEWLEARL